MRNVSDKFTEKIKTYILCTITFSQKSCRLLDNVEKCSTARQATDDNKMWCTCFACWVTKATDTLRISNNAFQRQQWLRKHASLLRYMHITHLHLSEASQPPPEDEGSTFFSNSRKNYIVSKPKRQP